MQIRHLKIRNFRGIKKLDWAINGDFVCLIGPGDSTKSTIIEAIRLALSPRPTEKFDDADFYRRDSLSKIKVEVTVAGIPEALLDQDKFGLLIRGWNADQNEMKDEYEKDSQRVLTIRLLVDSTLEPKWAVINDRNHEGKEIYHRDRGLFGAFNLDDFFRYHLTWGRNSPLSGLTGKDEKLLSVLAGARKGMLDAFKPDDLETICEFCQKVQKRAHELVSPAHKLAPGLDRVSLGTGSVALHDGKVPIRRAGLGTRRLLAASMRRLAVKEGGIALIDEIEYGLEPHRIRHLIQILRSEQEDQESDEARGQVIMATHSPVAIEELSALELHVVRSTDGITTITPVLSNMQNIVRKNPSAFLARRILVCEGKTEVGFCRVLDREWQKDKPDNSFGVKGIIPVNGGGTEAAKVAIGFAEVGYDVALLRDSDRTLDSGTRALLVSSGIRMIEWGPNQQTGKGKGTCIEERICLDLPKAGINEILELAVEEKGLESVRDSLVNGAKVTSTKLGDDPNAWWDILGEGTCREAVGDAAKQNKWFKRIDRGEQLGEIVVRYLPDIKDMDLARNIQMLRRWIDSNE